MSSMEDSSFKSDVKEKTSGEVSDISLSLRPFNRSDIDDFMIWAGDDNVTRFCTWDSYTSKEDGLNFIERVLIPHPWFKAICLDNKAIDATSVSENLCNEKGRGLLGYVLAYKYWGKGITTRAVKMVANTIFDEWPHLQRLEAMVDFENLASQKVMHKAGFNKEVVLRKYVILKEKLSTLSCLLLSTTDPRI